MIVEYSTAVQCNALKRYAGLIYMVSLIVSFTTHSKAWQSSARQSTELHQTIKVVWMDTLWYYIKTKGHIMAIKTITAKFTGFSPLIQNNPQGINPFNPFQKAAAAANKKYKSDSTEENFIAEGQAGIRLRTFWDDELGVYIPTRWISASIAKHAYAKFRTLSKDKVRAAVFTTVDKVKLSYDGDKNVKTLDDVANNNNFKTLIFHKIGQNKIPKAMPIFHKWSFELDLEFDDSIIDVEQLTVILEYGAKYNGFGDFRPSYGRCICEVIHD